MIFLENICFSYGKEPFFKELSLAFQDGQLTVLIGENGSGKTTLLKLIAGEEQPQSGCVFLDGKARKAYTANERARALSYFPQQRPTPEMTALEVVMMGRYPCVQNRFVTPQSERERALEALQAVGAEDFADRFMQELSYGQRQKIYLAMQWAQDAPNCLFDEPTNHLDVRSKFSLMEDLAAMKKQGRCLVCVLHDLPLALRYADRLVVLRQGSVLADGAPEALCRAGIIERAFGVRVRVLEDGEERAYAVLPAKQA
ncbi:MAG: ABC transporter ATP-binding protein [Clostridia bacterium]|nr:ABC transporter ATP-binding protein [Clostridia bacterium]